MHPAYVELPADSELAGHASHTFVPCRDHCPASHPVHVAEPESDLNPAGQILHVLTFVAFNAAEAYPGWQRVHVSLAPFFSESYDPAAHATHPSDPENE